MRTGIEPHFAVLDIDADGVDLAGRFGAALVQRVTDDPEHAALTNRCGPRRNAAVPGPDDPHHDVYLLAAV